MAEAKTRLEDKDEWIFNSIDRYTHLYMFDLEFPVDAFEVINDTSLCLAGLQTYSKNCEIVQLYIPPKLLPGNIEDGLCKDRDFNIISGGYSSHRITQIKAVHSLPRLLATVQTGKAGIGLFELGDDNHAVIIPKGNLSLPRLASSSLVQVIGTSENQIVQGNNFGKQIHEWKLDSELSSTLCIHHEIPEHLRGITKIKFWDENSVIFSTNTGAVAVYDLREKQIGAQIKSSKSDFVEGASMPDSTVPATAIGGLNAFPIAANALQSGPESQKPSQTPADKSGAGAAFVNVDSKTSPLDGSEATNLDSKTSNLLWSFDVVPSVYKVGIVDSCGGYESFDLRKAGQTQTPLTNRVILPGCSAKELLNQKFNIEYEPYMGFGSEVKFIVTGMKEENVLVYSDRVIGGVAEITPIFSHDGHSSTVTHARWHPVTKNLLFSTASDSTLHAWQYIHR